MNQTYFMKGGKLLSSGAYGCVYYPAISCSGKDTKNKKLVSKIQGDDQANQNELEISNKIRKIYNYTAFFAPIIETCPINIAELDRGNIKSCELLSSDNVNGKSKKYMLMKIPYVSDITFTDYLMKTMELYPKLFLHTLVYSYPYLLRSLEQLVKHNIVHYDLKGNNIMYDSLQNRPIIIDFGLSIDLNELHEDMYPDTFYIFAPEYYIWAPEIHMICCLLHQYNKPTLYKTDIQKICREIISKNDMFKKLFSSEFIKQYTKSFTDFMMDYAGQDVYDIINDLLQYSYTWDKFSLSIMYLKNICYITQGTLDDNPFIQQFTELLMVSVHVNPRYRNSVSETLEQFTNYLAMDGEIRADSVKKLLEKLKRAQSKVYAKQLYTRDQNLLTRVSMKIQK